MAVLDDVALDEVPTLVPRVLNSASGAVVADKLASQISSQRGLCIPVLHFPPHLKWFRNIAVSNAETEVATATTSVDAVHFASRIL